MGDFRRYKTDGLVEFGLGLLSYVSFLVLYYFVIPCISAYLVAIQDDFN